MHHRIFTPLLTLGLLCLTTACAAEPFAPDSEAAPAQPAAPDAPTTAGIIDIENDARPDDATQLVGDRQHIMVPEPGADGQLPESNWSFADGVLTASLGSDSVLSPEHYTDFRLHLEFNCNDNPDAHLENNGNSGIYIQQRYEVQIHNSHGIAEEDYKHTYCGSIYKFKKPDALVARPAGQWQTYDIVFRAPRYDGEEKVENARITVYHNGVLIHDDVEVPNKTGAGKAEGPEPGPIKLQGHTNPVRFRNVWVQRLDLD